MLRRALPLAETVSTGNAHATVDLAANRVAIGVFLSETAGATPASCVDLLGIRPLLTGAAWKVLDLLLEAALDLAGQTPDQNRGWSIAPIAMPTGHRPRRLPQCRGLRHAQRSVCFSVCRQVPPR